MSGISRYALEQTITGTLYVALFTDDPTFAGAGVECSYAGYARTAHAAWSTYNDPAGLYAERRNTGAITWTGPAGKLYGVGWWGLFDAASGGNLIAHGPFRDGNGAPWAFDVGGGETPRIIDGDLRVRVS